MSAFQELRAHLSHTTLRNGILSRLGVTAEFYSCLENERRFRLVQDALLTIDTITENHRRAIRTWEGRDDQPILGMRMSVVQLVKMARAMQSCKPSRRFPSSHDIDEWLDGIGDVIERFKEFTQSTPEQRAIMSARFAQAVIFLSDFLRDLDVDSNKYWLYFEPIRSA